jgi:hypothetical protein
MSKFLHKIHVWLYKNLLTQDPNDYSGRTKMEHVYDVAGISHLAETRGGANVKAEDMTRIVNLWLKEMSYQLCDNNGVNTGYFQAKLHIQGVFKSATDTYDPQRHKLLFEFQQGKLLRDELELVDVAIDGAADTAPFLDSVYDYTNDAINQYLATGGMIEIKGFNLKFLPKEPTNGIFLTSEPFGEFKLPTVSINKPQQLIAQVPLDVTIGGPYWLEVRTTLSSSNHPLKTLKVGRLPQELNVT